MASGRYNNLSEVVRSALRMLHDAEQKREAFVASLDAAMEEDRRDGFISLADVKTKVRATIDAARARKA